MQTKPVLVPRSTAISCRSAQWTLYNPEDVAKRLDKPVATVDLALEETGFNKAVRIREDVIRWKTNLLTEQKQIARDQQELRHKQLALKTRANQVEEMLINVRNILRIPREKPTHESRTR